MSSLKNKIPNGTVDSIREALNGHGDVLGYGHGCGYDNLQGLNRFPPMCLPNPSGKPRPPITFEELGIEGYNYMNGSPMNKTFCKVDGTGMTTRNSDL